jgi:uncharacterized membrane protein YbhN (UPF0104 family)
VDDEGRAEHPPSSGDVTTVEGAEATSEEDPGIDRRGTADLVWSYVFAYAGGIILLGGLIYSAGIWNFLAYTRLLALLVSGGIIKIHDAHSGYVPGVPQLQLWLQAKDPINFALLLLAVLTFLVFWGIKSAQFHSFCRYVGIEGSYGQHARAYLYGQGVNRLQPFNFGLVATATTLEGQGADREKAALVIFLGEMFVAIEIIAYSLVGLYLLGWTRFLATLFWPLVILGVCYLLMRPARAAGVRTFGVESFWKSSRAALRMLVREPLTLTKLTLLSLVAFGLEDLAVFFVMMSFNSTNVILTQKTSVILMGVVGSYIARFIPVTPGGVGQFEWGFASSMYMAGASLREVATIGILDNFVRYITGTLLLGAVSLGYGVETKLSNVLAVFRNPAEPALVPVNGHDGAGGSDGHGRPAPGVEPRI